MGHHASAPTLRRIATGLSVFTLLIGVLVLVGGWTFGIVGLRSVVPGTVGMKPLTAVGLGVAAGSLLLALRPSAPERRRIQGLQRTLAACVVAIGVAVLFEYIAGVNLGIDELVFIDGPGRALGIPHPGRLAPSTAACFVLVGTALLTIDARGSHAWRPAEVLVIPVALVSALAIVGYLYEIEVFYGFASAAKMALNTALCFVALVAAIIFARPRGRLVALATTDDPGGVLVRRVVPAALVMPSILGWASLQADDAGLVGPRVGTWLVSAVTIVAMVALLSYVAARLSADAQERRASQALLARSEELHRLTMANLPGAVVGLYDRELRCMLIEGAGATAGLSTAACQGKRIGEFSGEQVAADLEPVMLRSLDGEHTQLEYVSPRTGAVSRFEVTPFRGEHGAIEGVLIVSADISEQRRAETAQRESTELFEAAFSRAPIGIAILEPDGRFVQVNEALCTITGHHPEDLVARHPFALVHQDDSEDVRTWFGLLGEETDTIAMQHRIVRSDGTTAWVDARVTLLRAADGSPRHALAQFLDVTERRMHEHELQHLADHDLLTGLLNRRGFETRMEEHIAHVRRYGAAGALLMLDLDGFKQVNDTLGHASGDELIVAIGGALRRRLRETDVIARLGGDEFAVVVPGETPEEALHVARELLAVVREQAAALDGSFPGRVTASIGMAPFEAGVASTDMLIRGDLAMYEAKGAGKDRVAVYTPPESAAPGASHSVIGATPVR